MDLSSLYHFLRTAIPSYIIWLALISSSLTLPTQQCFAREFEELQIIFRSHKARAIKLRSLPQERFLAGEFQSLNHWIEQAERELAEEEERVGLQEMGLGEVGVLEPRRQVRQEKADGAADIL